MKAIQLVLPIVLVLIGAVPSAFAQYSDWNLTVYPVNVNWGDSSITVTVKGPYGWQQTQTINNGPNPYLIKTVGIADGTMDLSRHVRTGRHMPSSIHQ